MKFKIEWTKDLIHYYSYGAKINYEENKLTYINDLIPIGTSIIKWISDADFQDIRSVIQLPILQQEEKYKIHMNIHEYPSTSILIKVTFYNRTKNVIKKIFFDKKEGEFIYPKGAYSYSIEIISLGLQTLIFDHIDLSSC